MCSKQPLYLLFNRKLWDLHLVLFKNFQLLDKILKSRIKLLHDKGMSSISILSKSKGCFFISYCHHSRIITWQIAWGPRANISQPLFESWTLFIFTFSHLLNLKFFIWWNLKILAFIHSTCIFIIIMHDWLLSAIKIRWVYNVSETILLGGLINILLIDRWMHWIDLI